MLPEWREKESELANELAMDFEFAVKFLDTALSIVTERLSQKQLDTEDDIVVYRIGHALCVKSIKSYRSVVELIRIACWEDANIILRSMFEVALASLFVLQPQITLRFGKKLIENQLTPQFRAHLFIASMAYKRYRLFANASNYPQSIASTFDLAHLKKNADDALNLIGPKWAKRITEHPRTYSGLSVCDLARCLGGHFELWYRTVYAQQSESVHSMDLSHHVTTKTLDGRMMAVWHKSPNQLRWSLHTAGLMLWCILDVLNSTFNYGSETSTELQASLEFMGKRINAS